MSTSTIDPAFDLLDHYLAGDCTAEERTQVQAGLAANPIWSVITEELRTGAPVSTEADKWLERVKGKDAAMPATSPKRNSTRWLGYTGAALAGALVIVAGTFLRDSSQPANTTVGYQELRTGVGERAGVTLPDGSSIVVGPSSRIRYPKPFGARARDVTLDGEAVFTVTRKGDIPFIVHTRTTSTRVLGTVFGVRAFANDPQVQVIVADGKIMLHNGVVVTMGQRADVTADGDARIERNADVVAALSWTQGRLVFRNAPLRAIAADLERWYGLDIRITDSALAAHPVTGEFDNQPADAVLRVLQQAVDVTVTRQGSTITFSPR